MKKYLFSILIATAFIFGVTINKTSAAEMSTCQLVDLLITIGVIPPQNADNVRNMFNCTSVTPPVVPPNLGGDWSNICNNGKNYELTSDQRIYVDKIRMPTSYIVPSGQIKLGLRNINTGEVNYTLPYSYSTNEPLKIGISGNIAKDLVTSYNDYTVFLNISSSDLDNCKNIKQPMRVMVGDPFLGKNTAFVYPKNIIPKNVLNSNQSWATISVGQFMSDFDIVNVTDIVRSIEEKMFGHVDFDGDPMLMGLMPPACGSAGQPTGFGVGCLINIDNQPQWGVIFHEMGHIGDNHDMVYWDGIEKNYPNSSYYFGALNQNINPNILYSEGEATLAALYAERDIWQNNQKYNLSTKIIEGIKNQFYDSRSNYLKNLADYESGGAVFSTAIPDTLDGMFISVAENNSINKFGWEIYPKFFKIYQNPLPTFVNEPLTTLQYHTYFVAGLSAASGNDLRFLFRDKWHFPIDDSYFNEIFPKLNEFLGNSTVPPVIIDQYSYPTLDLAEPEIINNKVSLNGGSSPVSGELDALWCKNINSSASGDGAFEFNWGDSTKSCAYFPATHVYSNKGQYNIEVRVKNTKGLISSKIKSVVITSSSIVPPIQNTCSSFKYSNWTTCSDNKQSRTILESLPDGCTGGSPTLTTSCAVIPTICSSFTYSDWGSCNNGIQTRTIKSSLPSGCTAADQVLSQKCDMTTATVSCKFDAIKYADYYSDLKKAYGYDVEKLKNHWLNWGINENRTPCGADMPTCKFVASTYMNLYPDLVNASVDGKTHYIGWGINEGRDVCRQTVVSEAPSQNYATVLLNWDSFIKLIKALR